MSFHAGRGSTPQVWGYVPNYDRRSAWRSARARADLLSGVSVFQYLLRPDGRLAQYRRVGRLPRWLATSGQGVTLMVTNLIDDQWDRDLVVQVIGDHQRRERHLDGLARLAERAEWGIELDYEGLWADDREVLSDFVDALADRLHRQHKGLSLAVHAKLAEPGDWGGAQAQDWRRLGAAADRIVVMTYDHDPSRPGPIAPIPWTRAVLGFALSEIPPSKVFQGIPFYGYEWWEGSAAYRTYRELVALGKAHRTEPRRDEADRYLVLEFAQADQQHVVWVPDGETVAALAAVGHQVGVAGYAAWRLGGEDPAVWDALRGTAPR